MAVVGDPAPAHPNRLPCAHKMWELILRSFFYISILSSLLLHIFDIGTDVLVTVGLFHSDKVYFWVSISIIIIGALFSSITATLFGAAKAVAAAAANRNGKVDFDDLPNPNLDAATMGSCLCGLSQLGIFFDAFHSLKKGEKTPGYAFSRLFEALVESSAQSLLQLYIAMKHSRRTGDTVQYDDMLLYVSIFTSVVSNAFGTWGFERWLANGSEACIVYLTSLTICLPLVPHKSTKTSQIQIANLEI